MFMTFIFLFINFSAVLLVSWGKSLVFSKYLKCNGLIRTCLRDLWGFFLNLQAVELLYLAENACFAEEGSLIVWLGLLAVSLYPDATTHGQDLN